MNWNAVCQTLVNKLQSCREWTKMFSLIIFNDSNWTCVLLIELMLSFCGEKNHLIWVILCHSIVDSQCLEFQKRGSSGCAASIISQCCCGLSLNFLKKIQRFKQRLLEAARPPAVLQKGRETLFKSPASHSHTLHVSTLWPLACTPDAITHAWCVEQASHSYTAY
jgi:hypothetical protein